MPSTNVIYGSTLVKARTTPAVAGYHSFDFQKTDGTWSEFKRVTAVSGVSSFDWRFGGTHGVRVRFVPADPKTYAGSTSVPVTMTSVTLKP